MTKIKRWGHDDFARVVGDSAVETCVETGLMHGEQLELCAQFFKHTVGIELDKGLADSVRARVPKAHVLQGDSRVELPALARTIDHPVFWMLDAHYCTVPGHPIAKSKFPLWDELIAIRARPYKDIVVVDDVHTFGKKRDRLRFGDALEWEGVTMESISSFLGCPLGEVINDGYVVRTN